MQTGISSARSVLSADETHGHPPLSLGTRLLHAPPPYTAPAESPLRRVGGLPRGSVLILDAEEPERVRGTDLARTVRWLATRAPVAVALRLPRVTTPQELYLAATARTAGVSAVLLREQPLAPTLRLFLSSPPDLANDWIRWVQCRHPAPGQVAEVLRGVIRTAPQASGLPDLCRRLEVPERTLAYRLRQASLPRLERWYDGSRLLHAELALQRDPDLDAEHVARELGYADDLSFSNRFYRLFGVTVAASRRLLGLEWRLWEWWERSRRQEIAEPASSCRAGF